MPNLVLSTCGTSLLTQGVSKEMRSLVNDNANNEEAEIEHASKEKLMSLLQQSREKLFNSKIEEVPHLSAELNSIIRFYDFQLHRYRDHHILLTTDTFLGRETGLIVKDWLDQFEFSTDIVHQEDLQTRDLTLFQWALSEIVKWVDEYLTGYKERGYHIVFNLTGGFKSVQGFLQTLAMFYADETLYVFETGNQLFRLPRLPVKLVPQEVVRIHFEFFRKLDLGLSPEPHEGIPEVMLFKLNNDVVLSNYGQIVYQHERRILYEQTVPPPPFNRLKFGPNFQKSIEKLDGKRRRLINERIDDLVRFFHEKQKNINRLDFKPLRGNPKPPATHEIDAWADQDAKRIFGHFEDDIFVLDFLDNALH